MKRTIIGIVLGLILGSTITVFASESVLSKVEATIMDIKLSLNGDVIELENKPLVYNQRTYLPVREISELLELEVGWDQDNQMVTLDSLQNHEYGVDNEAVQNDNIINENNDIANIEENNISQVENNHANSIDTIYYNFYDVNHALIKKYNDPKYRMHGDLNNSRINYQGVDYFIADDDRYYDPKTGLEYFSEEYFLQFLSSEDLEEAPKYYIDADTNSIRQLK